MGNPIGETKTTDVVDDVKAAAEEAPAEVAPAPEAEAATEDGA